MSFLLKENMIVVCSNNRFSFRFSSGRSEMTSEGLRRETYAFLQQTGGGV